MGLFESDLAFLHSQEDTDFSTGGGPPSTRKVLDGVINDLFGPLTDEDRITGKNVIRRVHAAVDTATTDIFLRAHVILDELPTGDGIEITLSSTGNSFDRRPAIAGHFEAYFNPAGRFNCWIYQTQPAGTKNLQIWHATDQDPPAINSTLFLVQDYGTSYETMQPVRVVDILSSAIVKIEDSQGVFSRQLTTLLLNVQTSVTLVGSAITRFAPIQSTYRAWILSASVSDSTTYYGARPTTQTVGNGSATVHVDRVENQLVPAAQTSTSETNLDPNAKRKVSYPAGSPATLTTTNTFGPGVTLFTGKPFLSGSARIEAGATVITEANGELLLGGTVVGYSNPADGSLTGITGCPELLGLKSIVFTPVGGYDGPLQSVAIEILELNQDGAYNVVLPIVPAAGSLSVVYRVNGDWIDLLDRGDGICFGPDPVYGSGMFNVPSRTMSINLGRNVPDAGTWVIVYFGPTGYSFNRGGQALGPAFFEIQTDAVLVPSHVTITWGSGLSASDDGAGGLTGNATGQVYYAEKRIRISPAVLTSPNTTFTVTVTAPRPQATETWGSLTLNGSGLVELTLAHTNIVPNSVRLAFTSAEDATTNKIHEGALLADSPYLQALSDPPSPHPVKGSYLFHDDGVGGIAGLNSDTVDYVNGTLVFDPSWNQVVSVPVYTLSQVG